MIKKNEKAEVREPRTKRDLSADEEELLKFLEQSQARIVVAGTGGSGCNTLSRMQDVGIKSVQPIAFNTDAQCLLYTKASRKILLGKRLTRGLGAGSDPEVGEAAAKESVEDIRESLEGADMVFVTCGLGGGTGTGSAHIIAKVAKDMGALTVGVVTLPFTSEGPIRMENALKGLAKLRKEADTIIVIPNNRVLNMVPDLPLNTAFKIADEVLTNAVRGITELITKPGLVNLDFADLRTILKSGGCAMMGYGEAASEGKGKERALEAVDAALDSPLLDVDVSTGTRALVNVTGGPDMTLGEAELVVEEIGRRIDKNAHIIWGAVIEPEMANNAMRVLTVISGAKMPDYKVEVLPDSTELDLDYAV